MVEKFCNDLSLLDIKTISLSETIGVSSPHLIEKLFSNLTNSYPKIEFGAHFHTSLSNCDAILHSAYKSGCRRFDSTIKGFGGCPMANNDLVGNLPTEKLISFLENHGRGHNLSVSRLNEVVENFNYF